jgi:hypothetical protein
MQTSSRIAPNPSREVVADNRIDFPIVAESRKWFPGLAKKLSANKPAALVAHLIKEAERTVYDWCAGKFDPPARALVKLLHTEAGWTVLEYLMRGCKQKWWLETLRARECSAAYEARRDQLQLL